MSVALWSGAEAAAATGGVGRSDWGASGVSIDSRTLEPGDLFVALRGPTHDGHDHVAGALARGAAAAVVRRRPGGVAGDAPLLTVDDTLRALTMLGAAGRARSGARVVAVTGSVGKTGTKEALRVALAASGPTHASAASYNNHWGVPLSLARMPRDVRFGVFELGMNRPGEIEALAALVRPHVAVITAIEAAHLAFFECVGAIAEAKAEIFRGLEPGGVAVLDLDSPHFGRLRGLAEAAGVGRVVTFGEHPGADARLLDAALDIAGSDVALRLHGRELRYRLGAPGRHWVRNSLAVLAAVEALGADAAAGAAALRTLVAPAGRGRQHALPLPGGGTATLIDDSYNANPASMRAALAVLGTARGRKLAALGDMLELGPAAPELHAGLAEAVRAAGVELVFTVGENMARLHGALEPERRGAHVAAADELPEILRAALRPGDTLLVKGSLGSRMGPVCRALLAEAGAGVEPDRVAAAGGRG
ncbi:MAG TPA: UDP-N-acetylmuramoylalanyl-D-glutamyl-2,6-diaminopimelate--D-alanyl-D-alanine ligase [Geminicoccaceae bacterium]|nr:UDP-N-acetylmuramoylalanyl-D-glutamyl-2,6-diaminopimelate--D-alanyl-D-alanine ligase [Geminicoccaceae bacterium]